MVLYQHFVGTDGTCGEQNKMYKLFESLSCTPASGVTLGVNYIQIKKNNKKKNKKQPVTYVQEK